MKTKTCWVCHHRLDIHSVWPLNTQLKAEWKLSESCWDYLNFIKTSSMTMTSKDIWRLKWKEMVLTVEYLWKAYWKTRWKLSKKTSPGATCVLKPSPFSFRPTKSWSDCDCGDCSDIRSTGSDASHGPMVATDPWVDAGLNKQMVYDYIEESRYEIESEHVDTW